MKIAICSTFLGQKVSGGEVSAFHLVKNLKEHGEDVFAVTAKITKDIPFRAHDMLLLRPVPNLALLIGSGVFDRYMAKRMKSIFRKERPDVIHVQDSSILPAVISAAGDAPVVMTVRDYRFACNLTGCLEENTLKKGCSKRKYHSCLRKMLEDSYRAGWLAPLVFPWFYRRNTILISSFRKVKRFVAVSDFVKDQVVASGTGKDRIMTIKVQKEDWPKAAGEGSYVFSAGGLKKTKGFDVLLKAFGRVVKSMPGTRLRIAGDGSSRKRLEQLAETLGIGGNVEFLGSISRDRICEEYRRSMMVISPSLWPEPLSRIIFEAFSVGRPVIATDVGGSRELVKEGKTGLLVPPGDVDALGLAMIRLLDDVKARKRYGKAAFDLVSKECNAEKNYKGHMSLYASVV